MIYNLIDIKNSALKERLNKQRAVLIVIEKRFLRNISYLKRIVLGTWFFLSYFVSTQFFLLLLFGIIIPWTQEVYYYSSNIN